MKNVLMILFLLSGFTIQSIDAQKCCLPGPICPPGCCLTSCSVAGKNAAASTGQSANVILATMMLMGSEPACKMSQKEMRACMATCQSIGQKGPNDNIHTADASLSGSADEQTAGLNASSIHSGCQPHPSCNSGTASLNTLDPSDKQTRVKEKS